MNSDRIKLLGIVIFSFCLVLGLTRYIQNKQYFTEIYPVKASVDIRCGEILSSDKIYIDNKGKVILKQDINKYITTENYKKYLNFYVGHDIEAKEDLMLKDIISPNKSQAESNFKSLF